MSLNTEVGNPNSRPGPPPSLVVAIGSSAGGLEALRSVLQHLPTHADFSYVVAQHLAPQHNSMLTDLLSRETKLVVTQLNSDARMEAGHIYVTAPNHDVVYRDGWLRLQPPAERGPKPCIDTLLLSLAENASKIAVGVILSGSGADGSVGIRMLKSAGGLTIAQDPQQARYPSMPQNAITTECVDHVLACEQIGPLLLTLKTRTIPSRIQSASRRKAAEVDRILEKISAATKVDFRGYKPNTINRRIQQRLAANRCASMTEYLDFLATNRDEVHVLTHNCLVSVTSFFREESYFEALGDIMQLRQDRNSVDPLRVWVPGCATGEECFSLSILLAELFPNRRVQIFGTDLDEAAITVARKGWYPAAQVASVPKELLETHFHESTTGYQVAREVRDRVVFARHDLLKDPLFLNLDLISCRNLLIYLKPSVQQDVMRKFHHALKPGGLLFLGRSEHASNEQFDTADRKARIYSNKPLLDNERRMPMPRDWSGWEKTPAKPDTQMSRDQDQFRTSLVQLFAPPTVLVDSTFRVIESHGEVGRYLRVASGKPQFTLLALVPRGIVGSLRSQLQRAIRTGKTSRGLAREIEIEGRLVMLQTSVHPVERAPGEKLCMVSFQESELRQRQRPTVEQETRDAVHGLERELAAARENLHSVIEELETSNEELQALNEELQSSNEEMQATNEELHSSNEELQSTNEELLTVNEELEHKSLELGFTIEDLENIQNGLDSPLLVTDARGHFRHINSDARRLFGLTAEHLGTPLSLPRETGLGLQLASYIQKVMGSGSSQEFHATVNGQEFRVCLQPHVGRSKVPRGTLILFHDISEHVQINERLQHSETRLLVLSERQEATLNALPAQVALLDSRGTILVVNNAWKEFVESTGHNSKRHGVGGDYLEVFETCFQAGSGLEEIRSGLREIQRGAKLTYTTKCHSNLQHREQWFQVVVCALREPGGRSAVVMHHDITEHVRMSEKLTLQAAALQSTANGLLITDLMGKIDWVNEAFESMTGFSSEEVVRQSIASLEAADGPRPLMDSLAQANSMGQVWKGELELARKGGESITVRQTVTPILGNTGVPSHFIFTLEDTTEHRRTQARMQYLAEHDQLTDLWNRKSFVSLLDEAIHRNQQSGGRVAVLFLDLDRFKDTNDTLGHLVGDRMLLEIAQRLRANLRPTDVLARFGGDEFVIFLENMPDKESVDHSLSRVLQTFNRPIEVEGRSIFVTASVGVTICPDDGHRSEDLLRNADLAMYRAKAEGRRGYRYYDQLLETEMRERVTIEGELSRALAMRDLWVAFQPQVDLKTNQVVGAECLLRWKTGTERRIPIGKVIAIAEESGLILPIGEWVIRESLRQLSGWKESGLPLRISVNLSAVQFHQQDVFGLVMQFLRTYDLPPSSLKVEITETVLLNRSTRVREALHALHGAGIGLVLDDFGTGYSSLTYLQEFPIECVKIDTSFLKGIGQNGNDEAIVRGIIKLAHSLGQRVVAEGVETQAQLDFLREFECDYAQGYLFGHPLVGTEFAQHLRDSRVVH